MATYEFASLLNTTDGMTQVNDSTVQSKTLEVEGAAWYHYAGNTVNKLYINGKGYIGFGADVEHLKMFCATSAMNIQRVYRQEGTLSTGTKFLKLRIYGEYYISMNTRYLYEYEVFLFDDGNIFVYIIKSAKDNYNLYGKCEITDGKTTKLVLRKYDSDFKSSPISRLISNAGIKLIVSTAKYTPIKETGARVKTNPSTVYLPNELDWSELVVESYDSSGKTNAVSNFTFPDVDVSTAGTKTVNLSYKTYNLPVEITVKEDTVLELTKINIRDHYLLNEALEVYSITAVWESGKNETLTSGFDISGFDSAAPGTKELTISYKGVTATKSIYVAATATLIIDDFKSEYFIGDEFQSVGGLIEYDDGKQERVYDIECSGFDSTVAGEQVITATARGLSTTYTVNVFDTISANIGANVETDVTASLNLITGLLTVSGTGDTKSIDSPSYWGGGIFDDKGDHSSQVKKIVIQEGITGLIGACFYGMLNVTEVSLPSTLKTIGTYCFCNCSLITSLTLPEGLEVLQNACFLNCEKLTELTLPESLTTIEASIIGNSNLVLTVLSRTVQFDNYAINAAKTIRGYIGSTAETYAASKNIEFVALNKLTSVSIKYEPDTKEYWPLEEISTSGLVLEITDEDGVSANVDNGFEITTPDMETPGEKEVIVTYKGYTNTYKITVTAPEFNDILKNSDKMKQNNTLNIPWFMFDNSPCEKVVCTTKGRISFSGTEKIDVMRDGNRNYSDEYDASTTYSLETILDNGIRVAKLKSSGRFSGNYRKGSFGFEIFFFGTGDIYILISGSTGNGAFSGWNGTLKSGGKTYTIYGCENTLQTYQTLSAHTSCYHTDSLGKAWNIKSEAYAFPDLPQRVEIATVPDKIDYFIGDTLDTTGLVVTLVYRDGKQETSKGYTVNPPDMSTVGIKDVTVTDTETGIASETFNVYVNLQKYIGSPTEEEILAVTDIRHKRMTVSGTGATKDFDVLHSPFGVALNYVSELIIEEGITTLGSAIFAGLKSGVTVSGLESIREIKDYAFYYAKIDGELFLPSIEKIGADAFAFTKISRVNTGRNIKTIGEYAFNAETLTEISIERYKDSVSGSPWGAKNATVTWTGNLTSIRVTPPTKLEYITGEYIDLSGMVVTAVCDTGATEVVTDYNVSGYNPGNLGQQTITVTYKELTAAFQVSVYGTTTDIRIAHYPVKTYYKTGETLDTTGLVVMIIDSRGIERETTKYSVSDLDTTQKGEQTITVSYQEPKGADLDQAWFESFQVYVTNDATNPFMKENADITITVHWPNGEFKDLTNKDIVKKSMKLKESICNERYFIWGGCISNCLTFQTGSDQFWDSGEENVPRGDIELYIECEGTKEQLFTGTIDSGKRTKGLLVRTITAYDPLYKLKNVDIARLYKNWTTDKQMFLTQKQFRDSLFEYLKITQEDIKLMYDNAYVPNTWTNGEMKVVDILQDLCLQNCVFGWMNRKGKFRYLKVKPNARVSGTSQSGKESYEYYDCSVHYDVIADESTDITEGRLWYPKEFLPDPYPGLFSPGDITAQEAYEENIYYIRDSFFVGNDDWIEYVFDADEYGSLTRVKPLMKICYGTPTQIDSQHLYIAQGYNVKVRGNPLTRIGSKIQLQIRKRTPPFQGYPEGKDIIWKINSYIMSRTMEITGRGIMETYSAENGPYNSNKSQEGKHTQTYKAETRTTRSKLPTISYKAFSSGEKAAGSASDEIKKAPFKCIKKIQKDKYEAMLKAGQIRNDTLYCTWEED